MALLESGRARLLLSLIGTRLAGRLVLSESCKRIQFEEMGPVGFCQEGCHFLDQWGNAQ